MLAYLYALGAIALWISLAALGLPLKHTAPFLLTGIALLMAVSDRPLTGSIALAAALSIGAAVLGTRTR